jgi:hypothetical protein
VLLKKRADIGFGLGCWLLTGLGLILFLGPWGAELPAQTKHLSSQSLAHLYEKMSQEPQLLETDIKIYLASLPVIMELENNSGQLGPALAATGWTENRLIYAVTKIQIGLLKLFDPANENLKSLPDFVQPLPSEMTLLDGHRDEFNRAYTRQLNPIRGRK